MTKKAKSQLTKALLETAQDMRRVGVLAEPAYAKITKRHLREQDSPTARPLAGNEIKALRQRARMSQAVFAHHLNVTPGYVSQLERGAKRPTGAALVLLNVIARKGIETIL
jgi:putative transcriptional regulator